GASFDLQVSHRQMAAAAKLTRRYPDISIILNHAGMPTSASGEEFRAWGKAIAGLAECPNVSVKISGLGMTIPNVTAAGVRPIVDATIEAFGPARTMFASNFPVDRLFGSFDTLWNMYANLTQRYSEADRRRMFHDNATRIY